MQPTKRSLLWLLLIAATSILLIVLVFNVSVSPYRRRIYKLKEAQLLVGPVAGPIDSAVSAITAARRLGIEERVDFDAVPADTEWLVIAEVITTKSSLALLEARFNAGLMSEEVFQRESEMARKAEPYWRVRYLANGTAYSCSAAISLTGAPLSKYEHCGWLK